MPSNSKRATTGIGFTLVELLVVISIIVVLLAMLTPALDEAVYHAELAQCAGKLRVGATGVIYYATDHRRAYPHRDGPKDPLGTTIQWSPGLIANRFYDDRPVIFRAVGSELLLDPFCNRINLETTVPDNFVAAHYQIWFGWGYATGGNRAMNRMGDRFTFNGLGYRLLLSDADGVNGAEKIPANFEAATHPDREGYMKKSPGYQDAVNPWPFWNLHGAYATWTNWTSQSTGFNRGDLDTNFAYDDASVQRLSRVSRDDERTKPLGTHHLATPDTLPSGRVQVPIP